MLPKTILSVAHMCNIIIFFTIFKVYERVSQVKTRKEVPESFSWTQNMQRVTKRKQLFLGIVITLLTHQSCSSSTEKET